ncbi:MAG: TonB-dependent receptor [Polyangiaceae bacterium]|jgi:iron complex outermembrane receptor protein|nr:TonB-dependent receptor [Polyangiaceae bacterium]
MRRGLRAVAVVALASLQGRAEEVVVQANPAARRGLTRDDSVAGTVVSGAPLRAPGAEAADVLRGLPGVTVVDTGGFGALATASLRGATSAQTPVYLAGVRINDDVGGTADLSTVPLWLVDRVEVYRGHAPMQADRLSIGGAIFFDPRRTVRPGASASLSAGSFGLRSARVGAALGSGGDTAGWGALASLAAQRATNDFSYRDDRGTRFDAGDDRLVRRRNADVEGRELWLLGHARLDRASRLTALAHAMQRQQGVPGLALVPTRAARASLDRLLMAVRGEHRCPEDRCELGLTTSFLRSDTALDDPLQELALGGRSLRTRATRAEQSALLQAELSPRFTVRSGVDLAVERLALDDEQRQDRGSRRFARGALAGVWKLHDALEVTALGALECNGVKEGALCDVPVEGGRLGGRWRAGGLELLVNGGRYGRAPTLGEQRGVSATVRGNPGLEPERGLVVDGGGRLSGRAAGVPWAAELFVFSQWIDGLITYQRSSLGYLRPFNVGQTRTRGLEAAARALPLRWLLAEVAVTALDPRDTGGRGARANDILPFRSRLQVTPALGVRLERRGWVEEVSLEGRYVHQSSRYADASGVVVLPAQGGLDLDLAVAAWHRRLLARGRVVNVLDQVRSDVVGFPLPGRSFSASLELAWP